jgi:hypothetical protein
MVFGAGSVVAAIFVVGGEVATQTWSTAGSLYVVTGDLHVPSGATLTIQAGTVVGFAKSDALHAGRDGSEIELTVDGGLVVDGTEADPVVFRAQSGASPDSWVGLVVGASASQATITGAVFRNAQVAIQSSITGSPLLVQKTIVRDGSNTGIWVYAGSAQIDAVTIVGAGLRIGISIGSGVTSTPVSTTITNSVLTQAAAAISVIADGTVTTTIASSTFADNHLGVEVASAAAGSTIEVVNCIISDGGTYGIQNVAGLPISITYSDVHSNAMGDYVGTSAGAGCIDRDPMFVSSNDWHLQASSPCVGAGTASGAPGHDRDGAARTGPPEMGACQPGGAGSGCSPGAGGDVSTGSIATPGASGQITGQGGASGGSSSGGGGVGAAGASGGGKPTVGATGGGSSSSGCSTAASPPHASFAVMLAAFIILAGLAIRRSPPS